MHSIVYIIATFLNGSKLFPKRSQEEPRVANSFQKNLLLLSPFWKGFDVLGNKQESHKLSFNSKHGVKYMKVYPYILDYYIPKKTPIHFALEQPCNIFCILHGVKCTLHGVKQSRSLELLLF